MKYVIQDSHKDPEFKDYLKKVAENKLPPLPRYVCRIYAFGNKDEKPLVTCWADTPFKARLSATESLLTEITKASKESSKDDIINFPDAFTDFPSAKEIQEIEDNKEDETE